MAPGTRIWNKESTLLSYSSMMIYVGSTTACEVGVCDACTVKSKQLSKH